MTEPVTFPFVSVDSKRAKAGVMGFLSIPAARVAMEALGSCNQEGNMSALVIVESIHDHETRHCRGLEVREKWKQRMLQSAGASASASSVYNLQPW